MRVLVGRSQSDVVFFTKNENLANHQRTLVKMIAKTLILQVVVGEDCQPREDHPGAKRKRDDQSQDRSNLKFQTFKDITHEKDSYVYFLRHV